MRALFIGGIKSGKSKNAENYVLKHAKTKPYYLATTEFFDEEMQEKIEQHKLQRGDNFHTLEEPLELVQVVKTSDSLILIECVSMWINNMLHHKKSEEVMLQELQKLLQTKKDFVFVINDVSKSVVSDNALVREFVNINGNISQFLAQECQEVYNTVAGISVKIK